MSNVLIKGMLVWCVVVIAAIINGILREELLTPLFGTNISLPVSGITLSILVFLVTYSFIVFTGVSKALDCYLLGLFWLILTLGFEFGFGHYVAGKSWSEISRVFNLVEGDLFLVVLIITTISPWLTAKLKGLI